MCGAHDGPDHADPVASELCDAYHSFTPADLPLLEAELDHRHKEILWQVALGIGPDALAGRLGVPADHLRGDMRRLTRRLAHIRGAG